MIDLFDNLMRQILMNQIPGLTEAQVRFQPPDQDWRASTAKCGANESKLDHGSGRGRKAESIGLEDTARAFVVVFESVKP